MCFTSAKTSSQGLSSGEYAGSSSMRIFPMERIWSMRRMEWEPVCTQALLHTSVSPGRRYPSLIACIVWEDERWWWYLEKKVEKVELIVRFSSSVNVDRLIKIQRDETWYWVSLSEWTLLYVDDPFSYWTDRLCACNVLCFEVDLFRWEEIMKRWPHPWTWSSEDLAGGSKRERLHNAWCWSECTSGSGWSRVSAKTISTKQIWVWWTVNWLKKMKETYLTVSLHTLKPRSWMILWYPLRFSKGLCWLCEKKEW